MAYDFYCPNQAANTPFYLLAISFSLNSLLTASKPQRFPPHFLAVVQEEPTLKFFEMGNHTFHLLTFLNEWLILVFS